MIAIGPSLLAADFTKLADEIHDIEDHADFLHLDIMDGHFVPNISYGPDIVRQIRPLTPLAFDVHLMIDNPERYLEFFKEAGADLLVVHQEACVHLHRCIQRIHDLGLKAGVALNPSTPVDTLKDIFHLLDLVLIMSVNPGFGGQRFIPHTLNKVRTLRSRLDARDLHDVQIQVDGGVSADNAAALGAAGADWLVAGSAVFKASDRGAAIQDLRTRATDG